MLVPSCARKAETGMKVRTDTERVRHSRKMVLEFLGSSVDVSLTGTDVERQRDYAADAALRPGLEADAVGERDARRSRREQERRRRRDRLPAGEGRQRAVRARLLAVHPLLQVRRGVRRRRAEPRSRSPLPAVEGSTRGSPTEFGVSLPESACVYCGNCIGVCPTGALMFRSEHECAGQHLGRI